MLDNVKFLNRLAYLIGILSICIIIASIGIYAMQNWFTIEQVIIVGDASRITSVQLEQIAKNKLRGSFFTLDIDGLQQEFFKIPWVKDVVVERQFPDMLTVTIKQYTAIAKWGDDGYFLSDEGKLFAGDVHTKEQLPVFYADDNKVSQLIKSYVKMQPILQNQHLNLLQFNYLGRGLARILLSNKLQVVVCGSDISGRLEVLFQYLPELYKINPKLNYVNMCYNDALAINAVMRVGGVKLK